MIGIKYVQSNRDQRNGRIRGVWRNMQENAGEYEADGRRSALGGLKYADAFAGIDRILQNGASILRRKMMERCKHRSQPLQCTRNLHRVNRLRIESNVVVRGRADTLECLEIRIFIREPNLKARGIFCGVPASQLSQQDPTRDRLRQNTYRQSTVRQTVVRRSSGFRLSQSRFAAAERWARRHVRG